MIRLTLATLLIVAGCEESNPPPPVNTDKPKPLTAADYIPLADGQRLAYRVEAIEPGGKAEGTIGSRIEGTRELEGVPYFKSILQYSESMGGKREVAYYRADDDGVHVRRVTAGKLQPAELVLPNPPEIGSTWRETTTGVELDMRIESVEPVELAGKTYTRCLKVVGQSERGSIEMYYAPGVGLIRATHTMKDGVTMEFWLMPPEL